MSLPSIWRKTHYKNRNKSHIRKAILSFFPANFLSESKHLSHTAKKGESVNDTEEKENKSTKTIKVMSFQSRKENYCITSEAMVRFVLCTPISISFWKFHNRFIECNWVEWNEKLNFFIDSGVVMSYDMEWFFFCNIGKKTEKKTATMSRPRRYVMYNTAHTWTHKYESGDCMTKEKKNYFWFIRQIFDNNSSSWRLSLIIILLFTVSSLNLKEEEQRNQNSNLYTSNELFGKLMSTKFFYFYSHRRTLCVQPY